MIGPMKSLLLTAAALAAFAQAPEGAPAPSSVRGAAWPRIVADRRVEFQIKAPAAQKVEVMPGGGTNGMGKGPSIFPGINDVRHLGESASPRG